MARTVADVVDMEIQNALSPVSTIENLIELSIDWQPDLSKEEFLEFVKRKLKEFVSQVETELEDRI